MANRPISMSKIRHILRLQAQGRSKLQIAAQTGISRNTLKKYLKEFVDSGSLVKKAFVKKAEKCQPG